MRIELSIANAPSIDENKKDGIEIYLLDST